MNCTFPAAWATGHAGAYKKGHAGAYMQGGRGSHKSPYGAWGESYHDVTPVYQVLGDGEHG